MTDPGGERKAKKLVVGDRVTLKGRTWEVARYARRKLSGQVRLELRSGADTFTGVVPEDRRFTLAGPEPLTDDSGSQTRWATPAEAEHVSSVMSADVHPGWDDGQTPDLDPWVPSSEAEQAVAAIMGGTLIGAQRQGDETWLVPPVDGSTVLAHLLTFHATTPPSASLNDVRTPMAEALETAAEALIRADITGALTLHAQQHAAESLPAGATPHRHRAL